MVRTCSLAAEASDSARGRAWRRSGLELVRETLEVRVDDLRLIASAADGEVSSLDGLAIERHGTSSLS